MTLTSSASPLLPFSVGLGVDTHRLESGRSLILGGVHIDSAVGAVGHSDADALTHAVIDAILSAAHMGDIGAMFPDTDDRWRGASSLELLRLAWSRVTSAGQWHLVNISCVIELERPKLGAYRAAMESNISTTLGVPSTSVSVTFKTGEGVGIIGEGKVVRAQAVCLMQLLSS